MHKSIHNDVRTLVRLVGLRGVESYSMPRPCVTGEAKGECEMSAQLDSHGPVEPHARHVTADGRVAF